MGWFMVGLINILFFQTNDAVSLSFNKRQNCRIATKQSKIRISIHKTFSRSRKIDLNKIVHFCYLLPLSLWFFVFGKLKLVRCKVLLHYFSAFPVIFVYFQRFDEFFSFVFQFFPSNQKFVYFQRFDEFFLILFRISGKMRGHHGF